MTDFLDVLSRSHPTMPFREAAAFFMLPKGRIAEGVHFTSNLPLDVGHDVHMKALDEEGILENLANRPRFYDHIIHLHTHPGREHRKGTWLEDRDICLLPNLRDLQYYRFLAALLAHYARRPMTLHTVVLPICEYGRKVYFEAKVSSEPALVNAIASALQTGVSLRDLGELIPRSE